MLTTKVVKTQPPKRAWIKNFESQLYRLKPVDLTRTFDIKLPMSLENKIEKVNHQEFALLLVMFIFGFGWAALYVPAIICYLIFYNRAALSWRMRPLCWINYLAAIFFVFCTYLPGLQYLTVSSPIGTFFVVLFVILFIVPIFNSLSLEFSYKLIMVFLFGLFLYVASVVLYSLIINPDDLYLRSTLSSPFFTEMFYNTAGFSNYSALVFCGFLYFSLVNVGQLNKYLSVIILLLTLIIAVALSGRTFFIVVSSFSVMIFMRLNLKKIFLHIAYLIPIILFVIFLLNNEYPYIFEGILLKFEHGMESTRYEHWSYALQEMPSHPFGGFDVNQQIEQIHSFHNIFFDAARLGGWVPVLLLLSIFFLNIMASIYIKKSESHVFFFWLILFVLMLLMMQDVILEGTYKFFMLYVLLNNIVLKFSRRNYSSDQQSGCVN